MLRKGAVPNIFEYKKKKKEFDKIKRFLGLLPAKVRGKTKVPSMENADSELDSTVNKENVATNNMPSNFLN